MSASCTDRLMRRPLRRAGRARLPARRRGSAWRAGRPCRGRALPRAASTIPAPAGDRLAHPGYAALVDEIGYQLHFGKALEISDFRREAGVDKSLVAGMDLLRDRAPQYRLLVEQVGLAFLGEAGRQYADAAAAD